MLKRFQPLIVTTASVRFTNSCSLNSARACSYLISDLSFVEKRHCLCPRERRPFAVRVKRTLTPGIEQIEPLLGLARRPQVLRVHIEAEGTAVDLRYPEIQKV